MRRKIGVRDFQLPLNITDGKLHFSQRGEGNSMVSSFKFIGDQYEQTEFRVHKDGFEIQVIGEWEFLDLMGALAQLERIRTGPNAGIIWGELAPIPLRTSIKKSILRRIFSSIGW